MSFELTFVNESAAKEYDCGICLEKLNEPMLVCDDQLCLFVPSYQYE